MTDTYRKPGTIDRGEPIGWPPPPITFAAATTPMNQTYVWPQENMHPIDIERMYRRGAAEAQLSLATMDPRVLRSDTTAIAVILICALLTMVAIGLVALAVFGS